MGFAYKFDNPDGVYFVTSAVVNGLMLFQERLLRYCG